MISELPLYLLTPSCRLYTARDEDSDLGDPWWAIFWPGGQVRFPSCWEARWSRCWLDSSSTTQQQWPRSGCSTWAVAVAPSLSLPRGGPSRFGQRPNLRNFQERRNRRGCKRHWSKLPACSWHERRVEQTELGGGGDGGDRPPGWRQRHANGGASLHWRCLGRRHVLWRAHWWRSLQSVQYLQKLEEREWGKCLCVKKQAQWLPAARCTWVTQVGGRLKNIRVSIKALPVAPSIILLRQLDLRTMDSQLVLSGVLIKVVERIL